MSCTIAVNVVVFEVATVVVRCCVGKVSNNVDVVVVADFVVADVVAVFVVANVCLLYTSPSPRDKRQSRMPSSA